MCGKIGTCKICCNPCTFQACGHNSGVGVGSLSLSAPTDTESCLICKQVEHSARYLGNILEAAGTIVQVLKICGIHSCKAEKASDVIVFAMMHFDQYLDRTTNQYKRKLRKESLFNDLGRECQMNGLEAYLVYAVIRNVFKAFYYGQKLDKYKPDYFDECTWKHAINRVVEAYLKQHSGSFNCVEVENKIRCAFRKLLNKMFCNGTLSCCKCCQPASPCCPPSCCLPAGHAAKYCYPASCCTVSNSDMSIHDEGPLQLCVDPEAIWARLNANKPLVKLCGYNLCASPPPICSPFRPIVCCEEPCPPCACTTINEKQRSCCCQKGSSLRMRNELQKLWTCEPCCPLRPVYCTPCPQIECCEEYPPIMCTDANEHQRNCAVQKGPGLKCNKPSLKLSGCNPCSSCFPCCDIEFNSVCDECKFVKINEMQRTCRVQTGSWMNIRKPITTYYCNPCAVECRPMIQPESPCVCEKLGENQRNCGCQQEPPTVC